MSSLSVNNDLIVGSIIRVDDHVDQTQVSVVCNTGTYTMSKLWCERNLPSTGKLLLLSYLGYYKCSDPKSLTVPN